MQEQWDLYIRMPLPTVAVVSFFPQFVVTTQLPHGGFFNLLV